MDLGIVRQFWGSTVLTYLKSKYLNILIAATGIDANRVLFPLSYAVVDAENDDNWF